jgi:hypothetical protein
LGGIDAVAAFGVNTVRGGRESGCVGVDTNIECPLEYGGTHMIGEESEGVEKMGRDASRNVDEVVGVAGVDGE